MDAAPTTELVSLPDHRRVRVLAENRVERKGPPAEFFKIAIAGGVEMDAWMIMPANFDAARRYPVLVYVYGEPAGVTVTDVGRGRGGCITGRLRTRSHARAERSFLGNTIWPLVESLVVCMGKTSVRL